MSGDPEPLLHQQACRHSGIGPFTVPGAEFPVQQLLQPGVQHLPILRIAGLNEAEQVAATPGLDDHPGPENSIGYSFGPLARPEQGRHGEFRTESPQPGLAGNLV